MMNELINKAVFATFNPKDKGLNRENCIGFYSFRLLQLDHHRRPSHALIYGAYVFLRNNRVTLDYDGGDPPSAKAGAALDLHHGAAAVVRKDAAKIKDATAFFINDAGKLAAMPLDDFYATRAREVIATAPPFFEYDNERLYSALVGSAPRDGAPIPAPSLPPPPSL